MNWAAFWSAAAGVIVGVGACAVALWYQCWYVGSDSKPEKPIPRYTPTAEGDGND